MLAMIALLVIVATGSYAAWYELIGRRFQSTENAYVQGQVVLLTPQQAGTVIEIAARDTDYVQSGQVLVRLDPADAQIAVDRAKAQLAQTVREVRTLYGNNDTLAAQIVSLEAEVRRAATDVQRLNSNYQRRIELAKSGMVSAEDLTTARNEVMAARSKLQAARANVVASEQRLLTSRSLTEDFAVANHPNVKRDGAKVREAILALGRAELRAPVSGHVARRNVQLGQQVEPGASLMAVIPLNEVWVDANFKESQLRDMRIGQPVELTADIYGDKVVYQGVIEGLGAGTGAAFALLPAQNATGNWIKIIQRVPVRVKLDADALAKHPLRIGLSMHAKVTVEDTSGAMLAAAPRTNAIESLQATSASAAEAQAEVSLIIASNLGLPARAGVSGNFVQRQSKP